MFFGLLDKDDNSISAEVDVDIRIVNENDEEVYQGTKRFLKMTSTIIQAKPQESSILPMSEYPHQIFHPEHLPMDKFI